MHEKPNFSSHDIVHVFGADYLVLIMLRLACLGTVPLKCTVCWVTNALQGIAVVVFGSFFGNQLYMDFFRPFPTPRFWFAFKSSLWPFSGVAVKRAGCRRALTQFYCLFITKNPSRIRAIFKPCTKTLVKQAFSASFAFFILSDTNKADAWVAERASLSFTVKWRFTLACPIFTVRR